MAIQKNILATLRNAQPAPIDAQGRIESWLSGNYVHDSPPVHGPLVLYQPWLHQPYLEPEIEPETTSISSESSVLSVYGGVFLDATYQTVPHHEPRGWLQSAWRSLVASTGIFSSTADTSSTISSDMESGFSWGVRSPRQPRSLPEMLPEQPEIDEAGSGYEADVSDNADSSRMSSTAVSDSSSTQYTTGASPSSSSRAQYTPEVSSSDSSSPGCGSSDSDGKAQNNLIGFGLISHEDHELMNAILERAKTSSSSKPSWETLLSTVAGDIPSVHERLAELDREVDLARQRLHTRATHSYGEYKAEVAKLQALERERHEVQQQAEWGYDVHYSQFL